MKIVICISLFEKILLFKLVCLYCNIIVMIICVNISIVNLDKVLLKRLLIELEQSKLTVSIIVSQNK